MRNSVNLDEIYLNQSLYASQMSTPTKFKLLMQQCKLRELKTETQKYPNNEISMNKTFSSKLQNKNISQTQTNYQKSTKRVIINDSDNLAHQPSVLRSSKLKKIKKIQSQKVSRQNSSQKQSVNNSIATPKNLYMKSSQQLNQNKTNKQKYIDVDDYDNTNWFKFETEQLVNQSVRNKSLHYSIDYSRNKLNEKQTEIQCLQTQLQYLERQQKQIMKNLDKNQITVNKLQNQIQRAQKQRNSRLQMIKQRQKIQKEKIKKQQLQYEQMIDNLDVQFQELSKQFNELTYISINQQALKSQNIRLQAKITQLNQHISHLKKSQARKQHHIDLWNKKQQNFVSILNLIQSAKNN